MLIARVQYYCWRFSALLNNCCLTRGISHRSEMVSQTGVRLCLACNKLWLSSAAHMLSLSQADEWLWPLFIITKWLWEIMTGIFLQTSLYAHVTVSQSSFSAAQSVFKGNISEACGSFCTMQNRIFLFLLGKSPVGVAILRKLCRNDLVACWLIEWSVQVTPLSSCGTNGFHRTTNCCMLLSGNEVTLLVAPKPNSKHVSNLKKKKKYNENSGLSHATIDTSKNYS